MKTKTPNKLFIRNIPAIRKGILTGIFFSFLVFGNPFQILGQNRLHLSAFGGISNYQGDLQYRKFAANQSHLALSLGLTYDITPNISAKGMISRAKLGAHDKYNLPSLQFRNLSFETILYEGSFTMEYRLFDLNERKFTPYVFAGFAIFRFQPYTYDSTGTGKKIFLRPLSTEGQGLPQYPERKPYNNIQPAIPFGGGVKYRVTDNAVLGIQVNLRKLFTDYLDDVSMDYVDPDILLAEKGPLAVEYSYRADELHNGNPDYPAFNVRGSSRYNDWYYFTGITLEIGLNTGNLFRPMGGNSGGMRNRNSLKCPTNVY